MSSPPGAGISIRCDIDNEPDAGVGGCVTTVTEQLPPTPGAAVFWGEERV